MLGSYSPVGQPEQVYLDLKKLSARSSICIRKWRDFIRDPVCPVPFYRVGGKIIFYWPDVHQWLQRFRTVPDVKHAVDEVMTKLGRQL